MVVDHRCSRIAPHGGHGCSTRPRVRVWIVDLQRRAGVVGIRRDAPASHVELAVDHPSPSRGAQRRRGRQTCDPCVRIRIVRFHRRRGIARRWPTARHVQLAIDHARPGSGTSRRYVRIVRPGTCHHCVVRHRDRDRVVVRSRAARIVIQISVTGVEREYPCGQIDARVCCAVAPVDRHRVQVARIRIGEGAIQRNEVVFVDRRGAQYQIAVLNHRLVVHRCDEDVEGLRRAGVVATVGNPAVVLKLDHNRGRAVGIRGQCVRQLAGGVDGRLRREQAVVVVADVERERLARLVRRPGADRGGPTGHRLRCRILVHRLIGTLGKAGRIVDRVDRDRERLARAGVAPPVGRAAVVHQFEADGRAAVGVDSQRVGQLAGCGINGRSRSEQARIVVAGDCECQALARLISRTRRDPRCPGGHVVGPAVLQLVLVSPLGEGWFVIDGSHRDRHHRDVRTGVIILDREAETVGAKEVQGRRISRAAIGGDRDGTTLSRWERARDRCVRVQRALIGDCERTAVVGPSQHVDVEQIIFVHRVVLVGPDWINVLDRQRGGLCIAARPWQELDLLRIRQSSTASAHKCIDEYPCDGIAAYDSVLTRITDVEPSVVPETQEASCASARRKDAQCSRRRAVGTQNRAIVRRDYIQIAVRAEKYVLGPTRTCGPKDIDEGPGRPVITQHRVIGRWPVIAGHVQVTVRAKHNVVHTSQAAAGCNKNVDKRSRRAVVAKHFAGSPSGHVQIAVRPESESLRSLQLAAAG